MRYGYGNTDYWCVKPLDHWSGVYQPKCGAVSCDDVDNFHPLSGSGHGNNESSGPGVRAGRARPHGWDGGINAIVNFVVPINVVSQALKLF